MVNGYQATFSATFVLMTGYIISKMLYAVVPTHTDYSDCKILTRMRCEKFHMTENLYRVYAICQMIYTYLFHSNFYTFKFACMTKYISKDINPCYIYISWVCSLLYSFDTNIDD